MKLTAIIRVFNEVYKGNLERCLKNCQKWADEIVIYDDGSTDSSVEVARRYTPHILLGGINNVYHEQLHQRDLVKYAIDNGADWIMWIDADEILNRVGTNGGLRTLAETGVADAYSFHQVNLWRGNAYRRVDTLFDQGWFCRFWRVIPGLEYIAKEGAHGTNYPTSIKSEDIVRSDIEVIHYGFSDYKHVLTKIGVLQIDDHEVFLRVAENNWIIDETNCTCLRVPDEDFPEENIPDYCPEPKPIPISELKTFRELYGFNEEIIERTKVYSYDSSIVDYITKEVLNERQRSHETGN